MPIRRILCGVALGVLFAALFPACSGPPPGKDLIQTTCQCVDGCAGGAIIGLPAAACIDGSTDQKIKEALAKLCGGKETKGVLVCKIQSCIPTITDFRQGGCPPEYDGKFITGDFGQTLSRAVAPSKVAVSGGDIRPFTITPESFTVYTTQEGSTLSFTYLHGALGSTTFRARGIFGDDTHTLEDGMLLGAPFSMTLQPGGKYTVPPEAVFLVTGKLDGKTVYLSLTNPSLSGVYDEAAGQFTLGGNVKAVGADITMGVDLVLQFDNRPPNAAAGPDQTVECSTSGQTGTVNLSGTASTDPDGNGDIAHYTWYVDDVQVATGAQASVPLQLGVHEVKLIVADKKGSFDADTLALKVVDVTPPLIAITQPKSINYPHSETLALDYSVTDACTGVAGFTPLMDGSGSVGGHGLQSGQSIHLLTEMALGAHKFSISAVDKQGNNSSAAVDFFIVVTPESIQEAVKQFGASGAITHQLQFLLGRLANAAKLYRDKKCGPAGNIYSSFIQTVTAQRGKTIAPAAADVLIADAQFLIDHCP